MLDRTGRSTTATTAPPGRSALHAEGRGDESYAPLFTFLGFRYARVTMTGEAKLRRHRSDPDQLGARQTGGFTCGDAAVNRLVENTIWSQRSNFIEVPTDCPQRDERLGWTGDAQVFAGTACYLHDSHGFLRKYLRDVSRPARRRRHPACLARSDPAAPERRARRFGGSTGWGDAICIIPWLLYLHYGDRAVLEETLPAMVSWLDFVWSISDGPIVRPPRDWGGRGFTFGDWLQPVGDNRKPRPTIGDDCAATIYLFISSDLAAKDRRADRQ